MRPTLAVAICTRNRVRILSNVLEDLAAQARQARVSWELVVVDNGSSDRTAEVAHAFSDRLPLRVVPEPRPGLSVARNRALVSITAPLVVFTDDDVRLSEGWLAAWAVAAETRVSEGWFGGPVRPQWGAARPRWLHDESLAFLDGVLVRHELRGGDREYQAADARPVGANFGLRTDVVRAVGPFREDLGHQGTHRGLGEETDWLLRARAAGVGGWYVSGAVAHHPVDEQRLRLRSLWRHGVATGVALARMDPGMGGGSRLRATWALARGLRQLVLGRGDRFRQCVFNAGIESGLLRERRAQASAQANQDA